MRLKCEKNTFLKAVSLVTTRSYTRTTAQVLEGILITATNDNIKLTTYDLELGIECLTEGIIEKPGKAMVYAPTFAELIKKLPEGTINIYTDEYNMLNIECEGAYYRLATIDDEEFPKIPVMEEENSLILESKILKDMIKRTTFAVGSDDKKPLYTGCLFDVDNKVVNLVALDGFRLAINKTNILSDASFKIVVPGKSLDQISKILDDSFNEVRIGISKNNAVFEFDNCKITTKLLEGEFLNYQDIIANQYITRIKVNKNLLYAALDRTTLISASTQYKEKKQPIYLEVGIDKLDISSTSSMGSSSEVITSIETEGQECKLKYNPRYLLDAISNVEDQEISITFAGKNAPTTITSTEEESNYIYIVLPMRG